MKVYGDGKTFEMVGIYFSGTCNSQYAVELFCREYDKEAGVYSIIHMVCCA